MAWTERFVDAAAVGGGTGTSAGDPWTFAEAHANSAGGMKVNVKAGSYTVTTALDRNFGATASNPVWWSGYKTTAGDSDDIFTNQKTEATDFPLVTVTSNYFIERGGYFYVSSMAWKSQSSNRPPLYALGAYNRSWNSKYIQDVAVTNQGAVTGGMSSSSFVNCIFEMTSSSGTVIPSAGNNLWHGCIITGSNCTAASQTGGHYGTWVNCIFRDLANGVSFTGSTGNSSLVNCTFHNISGTAIATGASSNLQSVNNYFSNVGTAVSASSTAGTSLVANNAYESVTTEISNIFENLQIGSLNDATDKFVDSANDDFTLQSSSAGYASALPFMFQDSGVESHADIGAIQHADPSGGGGSQFHPLG